MENMKVKDTEVVITDNQEYYEITLVDPPQEASDNDAKSYIKILPKQDSVQDGKTDRRPPSKIIKRRGGRPKTIPVPRHIQPVKILPKPLIVHSAEGTKWVKVEEPARIKPTEQRSQTIDNLIERILKENTNEIDVFFRSMAASVKKLQPNLIPKVKMEVCNVIAKYEMQNFERNNSH